MEPSGLASVLQLVEFEQEVLQADASSAVVGVVFVVGTEAAEAVSPVVAALPEQLLAEPSAAEVGIVVAEEVSEVDTEVVEVASLEVDQEEVRRLQHHF